MEANKQKRGKVLGKRKGNKQPSSKVALPIKKNNISKQAQKGEKKIANGGTNYKKKTQNEIDDEEINSDEIDSESEGQQMKDKNDLNEIDDETEERKRVRLAMQILKQAKERTEIEDGEESSFDDGEIKEDQEQKFQGVIHSESKHADAVTKVLQNEILKKRQLYFTKFADKQKSLEKVDKYWKLKDQSEQPTILKGHTRCITSLDFTPDGRFLFSASKDASIIRWELAQTDQKLRKVFLVREKTADAHKDEILGISVNHIGKFLVTASKDKSIKLWDIQKMQLVQTFTGHRKPVLAIKFGINSNSFCSVSADRTFKLWDATDKAYIDQFFGHQAEPNSIDAISGDSFITCGFDRQVILWKTAHQSQLIYTGHDYSIDVVKAIDAENFITGSQDGSIAMWSIKKKKPIFTEKNAHSGCWITALGHLFNTDLFFSGSSDGFIHAYKIELELRKFTKIFSIPAVTIECRNI